VCWFTNISFHICTTSFLELLLILFIFADPPQVKLDLGRRFTAEEIVEGSSVYLECEVKANPYSFNQMLIRNRLFNIHAFLKFCRSIQRLMWKHNVIALNFIFVQHSPYFIILFHYCWTVCENRGN
jgi:hypothetical protein